MVSKGWRGVWVATIFVALLMNVANVGAQDVSDLKSKADQGDASAQVHLGLLYSNGQGVPQDYAEALKWYRKSAEQGDAAGQAMLGWMYNKGKGIPIDYVEAYAWMNVAAARGGKLLAEDRDACGAHLTPAQLAEAQALAGKYFELYQPKE